MPRLIIIINFSNLLPLLFRSDVSECKLNVESNSSSADSYVGNMSVWTYTLAIIVEYFHGILKD